MASGHDGGLSGGTSKRTRIISFKLPSMRERQRRRGRSASWGSNLLGSETVVRSVRFMRYCLICSASLFKAMAPWALAACECVAMTLLYFSLVPGALLVRSPLPAFHYSFENSLEDLLAFSYLRGLTVVTAYSFGAGAKHHRPYMWAAYVFASVGIPGCLVKLVLFQFPHNPLPPVLLLVTSMGFTAMHIIAAQNVVRWARKRYDMGLGGFGYPWEEGEEAWVMLGRAGTWSDGDEGLAGAGDGGGDVPPRSLADADSHFVECGGVTVHYKEASTLEAAKSDAGIMLIHGYGGGTFSWRHIMWPLAQACGCRVVAFDRPAFGLTSRPRPPTDGSQADSPYSLRSQAALTLALANRLGLRRVIFVGHSDGALLALLNTALAAELYGDAHPGQSLQSAAGGNVRRTGSEGAWKPQAQLLKSAEPADETARALLRSQSEPVHRLQERVEAAGGLRGAQLSSAMLSSRGQTPGRVSLAAQQQQHGVLQQQQRSPPRSEADGSTEPSTPDSRSRGSSSSQLTVVIVAPPERSLSTTTESAAAEAPDLGLLSPMLSPRAASSSTGGHDSAYFSVADIVSDFGGSKPARIGSFDAGDASDMTAFQDPSADLEAGPGPRDGQSSEPEILQEMKAGLEAGMEGGPRLQPVGLALLHPSLAGEVGPSFTRILGKSRLGRKILRPLLRSEIGEVSNRRAWFDTAKLTQEVMDAYQRPLRVQNWDTALVEVSRLKREVSPQQLPALYSACQSLPALVVTGQQDKLVPPRQAGAVAAELGAARVAALPRCGHLSHEEAPEALLQYLASFADEALNPTRPSAASRLAYSGG